MPYIWPAFSSKRRMVSMVAIGGELLLLAEVGDRLAVDGRPFGVGAGLVFFGRGHERLLDNDRRAAAGRG